MAEHPNAILARAAWQAVSVGDVDALERMFAPDVVWHARGDTPWRGDHAGRDAVLGFLARIGELMDVFDARLLDVLVSDERVALLFHVTGRSGGRVLETDYQLLARAEQDRVAEVWTLPLDPEALRSHFRSAP